MRFIVSGESMEPTYPAGSRIWVSRLFYKLFPPRAGDSLVVRDPRNGQLILKRVTYTRENRIFVEGDNWQRSTDSRHFGEINRELVIGKALFKYRG